PPPRSRQTPASWQWPAARSDGPGNCHRKSTGRSHLHFKLGGCSTAGKLINKCANGFHIEGKRDHRAVSNVRCVHKKPTEGDGNWRSVCGTRDPEDSQRLSPSVFHC